MNKEKVSEVLLAIGKGILTVGALAAVSLALDSQEPDSENNGKDYPMPNLKEDYHPHGR